MRCFTGLVESRFLKKATKELTSARTQLLKEETVTKYQRPAIIRWSFASKEKRRQFKIVWTTFGMDDHVCEGSDFLLDDYVSIVEDDDIEDIAKKFERDEKQDDEEVPSEEPSPEDEVPAEEPVDSEIGEESDITMDALENFINSSADYDTQETSLADYADLEMEEDVQVDFSESDVVWSEDTNPIEEPTDEEVELDLDEMKKEINNSIQTTLGKYFK